MTILIGVLCKDGVVVGADSSATFGDSRVRTIEQPCKKIEIIGDHIIITGTGQIGLGQRFTEIVDTYWKQNGFRGKSDVHACKELCALGIKDFISTNVPNGAYGSLMAFAANGRFNLCEFAVDDFQPELKTNNIWYVAMGSGQNIGDPFLGLIRRIFWKDNVAKVIVLRWWDKAERKGIVCWRELNNWGMNSLHSKLRGIFLIVIPAIFKRESI